MLAYLDNEQLHVLQAVLNNTLQGLKITSADYASIADKEDNIQLLNNFIASKRVEGCSEKTLGYYESTIAKMFSLLPKHVYNIQTDDLRKYLADYQQTNGCSKSNIDNIRRILSSFFSWLEDENYILKSPVRRIHKIRIDKTVKETYTDEALEEIRDHCACIRDLAIVDMLASTGMRIGELVRLNITDIDFDNRECVVLGKGRKERPVYFDARTKIHLKAYLSQRTDDNPALFVYDRKPYSRFKKSGIELMVRKIMERTSDVSTHVTPHVFRHTTASVALDRGMNIVDVSKLLGHTKVETTMEYITTDSSSIKNNHRNCVI